jgi:hypothetical protein
MKTKNKESQIIRKRDLEKQKIWSKNYRDNNKEKNLQIKIHGVSKEDLEFWSNEKTEQNLTTSELFSLFIHNYKNFKKEVSKSIFNLPID